MTRVHNEGSSRRFDCRICTLSSGSRMKRLRSRVSVGPHDLVILLTSLVLDSVSVKSARRYEELVVWQLSARLRDVIFVLTKDGPASRDFTFRNQIRDSSSSAPSNIAEGFAYDKPKLFARHLRIGSRRWQKPRTTAKASRQPTGRTPIPNLRRNLRREPPS
jgi:23S rRNA-intervening sequence protein